MIMSKADLKDYLTRNKKLFYIPIVILFLIPLLPIPTYVMHVLVLSLLFAYLCTSWAIVSGFAGQVSLGHTCFYGIGAYTTALLFRYYGLTPWIGGVIGIAFSAVFAFILGYACFRFRVRGPYFTFATLASTVIFEGIFISQSRITGGELGVEMPYTGSPLYFQFTEKVHYYIIILVLWLGVLFLSRHIQNSKFGYYLFAIREDEEAAEACGINTTKYKIFAFVLSAALTGFGGVFHSQYYLYITPKTVYGLDRSFQISSTALVGGSNDWFGPSLGSFLINPIVEWTRATYGGTIYTLPLLVYGLLMIFIGRFLPGGVSGMIQRGLISLKGEKGAPKGRSQ